MSRTKMAGRKRGHSVVSDVSGIEASRANVSVKKMKSNGADEKLVDEKAGGLTSKGKKNGDNQVQKEGKTSRKDGSIKQKKQKNPTTTNRPDHTPQLDNFLDDPLVHQTSPTRNEQLSAGDATGTPVKKRTNRRPDKHQRLEAELEQVKTELENLRAENLELRQAQELDRVEGDIDPLLMLYDETEMANKKLRLFEKVYGSFEENETRLKHLAKMPPGDTLPGMIQDTGIIEDGPNRDVNGHNFSSDRIAALEGEVKGLKGVEASRDLEVNDLHHQVSDLEKHISQLDAVLRDSNARLKSTQEELKARDKALSDSRSEINRLDRQLRDMRQGHQLSPSTLALIKTEHKRLVQRLEDEIRTLKVDIDQQRIKRNDIGRRFEKRVSYLAQLRKVLRDNNIPLPSPLKGMEFSFWDDDRNPAEAVAAFRNGR